MRKYIVGDIIEIITASYKNWNEVPDHAKGYYTNNKIPFPFIGQRLKVDNIIKDEIYCDGFNLKLNQNHIILYKRPIKNWIKYLYYLIK